MRLFGHYARAAEAIARIGEEVRAEARVTGTTISYTDPAFGADVIREYPNGRRERLQQDGSVVEIPPTDGSVRPLKNSENTDG